MGALKIGRVRSKTDGRVKVLTYVVKIKFGRVKISMGAQKIQLGTSKIHLRSLTTLQKWARLGRVEALGAWARQA